MMKLKSQEVVWDKSCFDCAVTRGWTVDSLIEDSRGGLPSTPADCLLFMCIHRTDLKGKQRVCAAMKKNASLPSVSFLLL